MKIYERLKDDHNYQRELGEKIVDTQGDTSERHALWTEYKTELESHAMAEEQVFYSDMMSEDDLTKKARHSVAEHKELSDMIREIDDMDMSSPGWLMKFKQLKDCVEHHVAEEEKEVFPETRKEFSEAQEKQMCREFETKKRAALDDLAAA
ncbi:hemerythrin domain-containing protein [Parvularcula sp. IMCC14364]|uniref:hemerythrin domain-containing protein n=1 Tax=Parvularcula sp. IMCC14364 TaxID=3067902 RepID=UPI002741189E|nr:hemerythrin domain-containing protein [Parvularcula sp. IMCC14364]